MDQTRGDWVALKDGERPAKCLALIIFLIIIFAFTGTVQAGRPLSTDDAWTVEPKHLELDTGIEYAKQPNGNEETAVSIKLTTGLFGNRFEFGLKAPYLFLNPDEEDCVNGLGDASAGFKLRFLDETDNLPAMAATAWVKTTTGHSDKGLGTENTDYYINLIATKCLNRTTLHANLGHIFTGEEDWEKISDVVTYGIAAEFEVIEKLSLVGEITGGIQTGHTDTDNSAEILAGLTYELPSGTVLDAGAGFGLTDGSPDYRIIAGFTHEF